MASRNVYRYRMAKSVSPAEAEATFLRAIAAVESLHGESEVRLEARHAWDESGRICVLDAGSRVGRNLNRLFVGFLRREFGDDAFVVERVESSPPHNNSCQSGRVAAQ